jgi:hydroxymethylbilane synthase
VPQVGQGALAVECRRDDDRARDRLAKIESSIDRGFVDLERAFLAELGGGCDLPVGAHAHLDHDGQLVFHSFLSGPGGVWRDRRHGHLSDHTWVVAAAREAAAAVALR